ncbi:mechanosensitive ion channel family protein [Xylanimonas ulmi]|uniref:Small conductance mechanosensitive channel n=1 Tax=Xylanimonas ulmi TaxID=228973 RepID=A0A4Q7M3N7_9MICO|nr:mechanosensitive ion channel family protein [Xylanibacterium ulmi]RZS61487.1 small conductance mechanosensitive channel [Xylanibacterium ulmi]
MTHTPTLASARLAADTPSPTPTDVVDLTVDKAARFWDWFTGWPLHVLLILVIGALVLVLVRRTIAHVSERIANGYHRAYAAVADDAETPAASGRRKSRGPRVVLVEDTLGLVTPEVKQRRAQRARTVGSVLGSAANIVIGAVMALMILTAVGAGDVVTPLLASAGVVGVAVGFGAQSLVRDFLSGIFILIEDQFGVGDEVDLGAGAVGVVERVDLRLTHVRSFDGTLWHVRNGEILRAGNHTQQWARAVAKVAVPVGSDVETVRAALSRAVDVVRADPAMAAHLIETPQVRGVDELGDGSYTFTLHGRVRPGADGDVARALLVRAQLELLHAGVIEAADAPNQP